MSPACYEEVGDVANKSARKLTTSRGSYEELVPVEFGVMRRLWHCTRKSSYIFVNSAYRLKNDNEI